MQRGELLKEIGIFRKDGTMISPLIVFLEINCIRSTCPHFEVLFDTGRAQRSMKELVENEVFYSKYSRVCRRSL